MTTKTTVDAADKKKGMTVGEVRNAIQGLAFNQELKAHVGIGGRIKSIEYETSTGVMEKL